jgi:membrane peptidoglycan carboxypeptidase
MAPAAARTMLGIMRGVTETGGTARKAAIEGYSVGGKTGTAQKVSNGHYDPDKWISSFVGVVPIEDPRLVIIVVVDEPQGSHLGGAVAAPVFHEIAEEALRYLRVPPTAPVASKPGRDAGKDGGKEAGKEGGRKARTALAAVDADDGSGESPPTEMPPDDDALGEDPALAETWNQVAGSEGGVDTPPVERVVVPDFSGLSLGQAVRAARKSGVELAFEDSDGRASGVAVRQRPAPGPAPRGVVCRVVFGRRQ